jgi:amidase
MNATIPSPEKLTAIASTMGLHFAEGDAESFLEVMNPFFAAAEHTLQAVDPVPQVGYPRTPGYRPGSNEDPLNAWYRKTSIKGAPEGKLKGMTAALKDNVLVAGVPMMNGSSFLDGYVPELDATVVTRLLDAGAEITGKLHCEYFCLSGSSHTNATGACHNPWKRGHSAGGSSSGSGAAVAAGEVDLAIGGDQGGSIRIPASFCGIVGMKPTHGLVPYTGIMSMEVTIDHAGPMTRTVAENALMLEVIAGPDGYDVRQNPDYAPPQYTKYLDQGVKGLRIAVVKEGFGLPESDPAVDAKVKAAASALAELGAIVEEVSCPMHTEAVNFFMPMAAEGMVRQVFDGNGVASGANGLYSTTLTDRFRGWKERADEFPDTVKVFMLLGRAMADMHGGKIWAKALNLRRSLRARYAAFMRDYDILLMPTTPMTAPELPPTDAPREVYLKKAWEMLANTAPYNATGMPSITLPCGLAAGLPVGLMLTGRMYDEATLYRAAYAFEQRQDWKTL